MWPWSTIRAARREAEDLGRKNEALTKAQDDLRRRWSQLNEDYETLATENGKLGAEASLLKKERGLAWTERDAARTEYTQMKARLDADVRELRKLGIDQRRTIAELREALAKASKNNQRDAKGRFAKSPPWPTPTEKVSL